jgi:uncharacterized membrane protein YraQ (UPF0718 family)
VSALFSRAPEVMHEFLHLLITVFPYFLIGAVEGAALTVFIPERWARLIFNQKNRFNALLSAATVGAILPGCSCATIPMAAGIKDSSKPPLAVVATFIFMSPLLSPQTIFLTYGMLGLKFTIARILAAFFGSVLFGAIVSIFEKQLIVNESLALDPGVPEVSCGTSCIDTCGPSIVNIGKNTFWKTLLNILRSITPYFLLGMFIAAIIRFLFLRMELGEFLVAALGFGHLHLPRSLACHFTSVKVRKFLLHALY